MTVPDFKERLKKSSVTKAGAGGIMFRPDAETKEWLNDLADFYNTSVNKVVLEIIKDAMQRDRNSKILDHKPIG